MQIFSLLSERQGWAPNPMLSA